jgi:cell shape-determining protein MreC
MPYPRLSARGWFWALTLAAFIWAYAGTRTPAKGFMLGVQGFFGYPIVMLTTPGSWVATMSQGVVSKTFKSIGSSRYETRTVAALEEENKKLQDHLAIKDGQISELIEEMKKYKMRASSGIPPENLRVAYITGRSPGAGANTITIDKGTMDGVAAGMPVIAGENHILGRVSVAGPKNATVRLITDNGYMVRGMIARHINGKTVHLLKEPCLISGYGNGQFGTDVIKTNEAAIEKGDIIQLMDREWPAKLQYFILGEVAHVGTSAKQMLRYEVRGRANINEIQSVEVLMKY